MDVSVGTYAPERALPTRLQNTFVWLLIVFIYCLSLKKTVLYCTYKGEFAADMKKYGLACSLI